MEVLSFHYWKQKSQEEEVLVGQEVISLVIDTVVWRCHWDLGLELDSDRMTLTTLVSQPEVLPVTRPDSMCTAGAPASAMSPQLLLFMPQVPWIQTCSSWRGRPRWTQTYAIGCRT